METNMERGMEMKKQPPVIRAATTLTAAKPFKKVQVVYYLSTRNGHLEHPHYMEVTLLAHHQLRLRDVIDRLSALRGKAMPSIYSWSCKRSYKNGYVWNDLSENDIIHPTDGAEYVLKGSAIMDTFPATEFGPVDHVNSGQLIQDHLRNHQPSKRSMVAPPIALNNSSELVDCSRYEDQDYEEYDVEDKTCYTTSTTPQSRPSHRISTDELDSPTGPKPRSEPNTKPTSKPHSPLTKSEPGQSGDSSRRYLLEDAVSVGPSPVPRSSLGRNSVLMQLISCGNIGNSVLEDRDPLQETPTVVVAVERDVHVSDEGAEKVMIQYMSENPRCGNPQLKETKYFSGRIVEGAETKQMPKVLKRSNSYNDKRSSQVMEEADTAAGDFEEEMKEKAAAKSKCIPLMIMSSSKTAKRK